jgi:uncharacterized integral membrane protein
MQVCLFSSQSSANRDRRVTALLAGRRGAGQRVRFVKPIAVSSAEPGGTPATVHPRPPHRRSRPRSKGRNVPGSAQCGVASALCAVLLLLLLVFILENSQRAATSDFGAHGHLPPGVALLLAGVLGMLLAVIEALGPRMQQRNAAPKSPDLTQARRRTVTMVSEAESAQPGSLRITRPGDQSRPGTRDKRSCRRQRRLQRSAIHDAEGSTCGVLRKDFPSP